MKVHPSRSGAARLAAAAPFDSRASKTLRVLLVPPHPTPPRPSPRVGEGSHPWAGVFASPCSRRFIGPGASLALASVGLACLIACGAQGGMITADNRRLDEPSDPLKARWHDSRTWEECVRIGHLMATEAQRIVKDAPPQVDPPLACYARDVKFPVDSKLMWMILLGSRCAGRD